MKEPKPIFTNNFKNAIYKLPWWKKILFKFLPTYVVTDRGIKADYTCEFKKWRGVIYLVDNYETD